MFQKEVYDKISFGDVADVRASTEDEMRDTFGDLYADFVCTNKRVFTLNIGGYSASKFKLTCLRAGQFRLFVCWLVA